MGQIIAGLLFYFIIMGSWITHLVVCIQAKEWLFMLVGSMVFPVGILHGIATWLGYNWL